MKWIMPFLFLAAPAFGQSCPPVNDHSASYDAIMPRLAAAPTPADAQELMNDLWLIWTKAPDEQAQELLDEGMRKREGFDLLGARDVLDELVEYCPDYAEGYNQRAFASFLRQDYPAALYDLDRALEIVPNHVAALAGKGLTLLGMGRNDEGQAALKAAVAMNPWLNERTLITDPLEQDI